MYSPPGFLSVASRCGRCVDWCGNSPGLLVEQVRDHIDHPHKAGSEATHARVSTRTHARTCPRGHRGERHPRTGHLAVFAASVPAMFRFPESVYATGHLLLTSPPARGPCGVTALQRASSGDRPSARMRCDLDTHVPVLLDPSRLHRPAGSAARAEEVRLRRREDRRARRACRTR